MRSEDFDSKIRDAAEHHHPAYDEKAWEKMEQLLDKHLPREEKRRKRRIMIWWFTFLAGAGIALWLGGVFTPVQKGKVADRGSFSSVSSSQPNSSSPGAVKQEERIASNRAVPPDLSSTPEPVSGSMPSRNKEENVQRRVAGAVPAASKSGNGDLSKPSRNNPSTSVDPSATGLVLSRQLPVTSMRDAKKAKNGPAYRQAAGSHKQPAPGIAANENTPPALSSNPASVSAKESVVPPATMHTDPVASAPVATSQAKDMTSTTDSVSSAKQNDPSRTDSAVTALKPAAPQKKRSSGSGFLVTVSAGPDLAFVGGAAPGQVRLNRGIGIGYTYRNRLTIRTGYFSSRKIYDAPADAYDPPAVFWNYYPFLDEVKGNCTIHEIPILLSYRFGKPGRGQWMATAGISSYLMKKEEYYYTYKTTQSGPSLYREWTNKKPGDFPFSVLTLSAGYEYRLNKRMQLLAEPYFKLPLAGVGYGKVKLNSTGVLFTLGWRPFGH